jgi:hypothetical protein
MEIGQPVAYKVDFCGGDLTLETRNLILMNGAGDGIRTRDVLLGRQALCH